MAQRKRLMTYADNLYKILQDNPYLANKGIGIGWQEFKVWNDKKEVDLDETAWFALKQIEDKKYEAGILAQGFAKENIIKLGFAFTMKRALVMM